jgi:hypothetical protein
MLEISLSAFLVAKSAFGAATGIFAFAHFFALT